MNWIHNRTTANAAVGFRNENDLNGSHMPLCDGVAGWNWRNPLNLLPLTLVLLVVLGLVFAF